MQSDTLREEPKSSANDCTQAINDFPRRDWALYADRDDADSIAIGRCWPTDTASDPTTDVGQAKRYKCGGPDDDECNPAVKGEGGEWDPNPFKG